MKKGFLWLASILLISSGLLFSYCSSSNEKVNHQLSKMANELNKSVPVVLDEHTRLDSVSVTSNNIFQYHYSIINIDNPHQLLLEQRDQIIGNIEKAFMIDKSLQIFTRNNVIIQYIYRDVKINVIDTLTINSEQFK